MGRDEKGKARYNWHTVHGGKKKAEDECARLLSQVSIGEYVEPSKMTLKDFFERWLEDYAKANVAAKTFERYAEIINKQLVPALGHYRLTKLQPLQIQSYYTVAL